MADDATRFRVRAKECRDLADHARDEASRRELREIAQQLEDEADKMDGEETNLPPIKTPPER